MSGSLIGDTDTSQGWEKAVFISTWQLITSYTNFDKKAQWYRTIQQSELITELKRLCPTVRPDRQVDRFRTLRRGWWLPDLVSARRGFEKFIGGSVDWPGDAGATVGLDAATLDVLWADREPPKKSVSDILAAWDEE